MGSPLGDHDTTKWDQYEAAGGLAGQRRSKGSTKVSCNVLRQVVVYHPQSCAAHFFLQPVYEGCFLYCGVNQTMYLELTGNKQLCFRRFDPPRSHTGPHMLPSRHPLKNSSARFPVAAYLQLAQPINPQSLNTSWSRLPTSE